MREGMGPAAAGGPLPTHSKQTWVNLDFSFKEDAVQASSLFLSSQAYGEGSGARPSAAWQRLVTTHLPLGDIWLHQPCSKPGPNLLPEVSGRCTLPPWKQEMVRG